MQGVRYEEGAGISDADFRIEQGREEFLDSRQGIRQALPKKRGEGGKDCCEREKESSLNI